MELVLLEEIANGEAETCMIIIGVLSRLCIVPN
jgi:hypothetical protein